MTPQKSAMGVTNINVSFCSFEEESPVRVRYDAAALALGVPSNKTSEAMRAKRYRERAQYPQRAIIDQPSLSSTILSYIYANATVEAASATKSEYQTAVLIRECTQCKKK